MTSAIEWIENVQEGWLISADSYSKRIDSGKLGDILIFCSSGAPAQDVADLIEIYPQIESTFQAHHKPDFVFINLKLKSVLCAGLGRKDQIFIFDVGAGVFVGSRHKSTAYINFIAGAFDSDVDKIISALESFGKASYDYAHLVSNMDSVDLALENGPDENGGYHIEGEDEVLSRAAIECLLIAHKDADQGQRAAAEVLTRYFFELDVYGLVTGDY